MGSGEHLQAGSRVTHAKHHDHRRLHIGCKRSECTHIGVMIRGSSQQHPKVLAAHQTCPIQIIRRGDRDHIANTDRESSEEVTILAWWGWWGGGGAVDMRASGRQHLLVGLHRLQGHQQTELGTFCWRTKDIIHKRDSLIWMGQVGTGLRVEINFWVSN